MTTDDDVGKWVEKMRRNYRYFFNDKFGWGHKHVIGNQLEILEELGFDSAKPPMKPREHPVIRKATTRRGYGSIELHNVVNLKLIMDTSLELGHFASRMRSLYHQRLEGKEPLSNVEKEKVRFLGELGFAFDGTFDVNLEKYKVFKQRTGKLQVPVIYEPDKTLANWAGMVRKENRRLNRGEKSDYLTVDRLRKLATVGFGFGETTQKCEPPWEEYFHKLSAYRNEHGKDPTTSHPELGYWISKQRLAYNKKVDGNANHNMTDEREEKLRSIGFVFQKGHRMSAEEKVAQLAGKKKTFDDRVADFIAWKEKHGHPYVPREGEDKHLGRWVARMRLV